MASSSMIGAVRTDLVITGAESFSEQNGSAETTLEMTGVLKDGSEKNTSLPAERETSLEEHRWNIK